MGAVSDKMMEGIFNGRDYRLRSFYNSINFFLWNTNKITIRRQNGKAYGRF